MGLPGGSYLCGMERFDLEVRVKIGHRTVSCALQTWGYSYRIFAYLEGSTLVFEPDEERNFRAVQAPDLPQGHVDPELVAAIATALEEAFK